MAEINRRLSVSKRTSNTFLESNIKIIVFGATGRIGSLISSILLSRGCSIILVVRDPEKVSQVIEEHLLNRIENIIVLDLNIIKKEEIIEHFAKEKVFENDNKYIVINAMEIRHKNRVNPSYKTLLKGHENLYYLLQLNKGLISKIITFTSNYTNYPFSLSSILINLKFGFLLYYRKRIEELLFNTKIDFLLLRPGKILSFNKELNVNEKILEKVYCTQDKLVKQSSITDASFSRYIFDLMFDCSITNKCVLDCYSHIGISNHSLYMNKLQEIEYDYFEEKPAKPKVELSFVPYEYKEASELNLKRENTNEAKLFSSSIYHLITSFGFIALCFSTVAFTGYKLILNKRLN